MVNPMESPDHFNETFRVCEMGPVERERFINCRFEGPAVIVPQRCNFTRNHFQGVGAQEGIFWDIPDDRRAFVGAILFLECEFEGCTFAGVGIAVPRSKITAFIEG
jgi:hypothetical protein